ncbi:hypothetical protein [Burkholderia territorii]|uniref:hypothetical protein n=1 Tax=Burkholderia territorii TaxID=1503055 RepID=UPI000A89CC6E|nr:hypothetical protein [Burkholderia territorii]
MNSRNLALHARAQWALYKCALLAGDNDAAEYFRIDAEASAKESGRCSYCENSDMPMFLADVRMLSLQWKSGARGLDVRLVAVQAAQAYADELRTFYDDEALSHHNLKTMKRRLLTALAVLSDEDALRVILENSGLECDGETTFALARIEDVQARRRTLSGLQPQWAITYKTNTGFDVEIIYASSSVEARARAETLFGSRVVEIERVA